MIAPVDLATTALLLDVDGTLVEIADRPEAAIVPDSLRATLVRLQDLTGAALALVSGRPIAGLDALFAPLRLSAVGGHGAEMRINAGGEPVRWSIAPLDDTLRARVRALAGGGIIVEDKLYSLAVHFRLAPERETEIRAELAAARLACPVELELLEGKQMIEFKTRGHDKGTGVRALMQRAPFAGRRPLFIGDDITDEFAVAAMPEFSGRAFAVGRDICGATRRFETPAEVRDWLADLAEHG